MKKNYIYNTNESIIHYNNNNHQGAAIYNRMVGVTTIVSSSFEQNVSEKGPAIYAIEEGKGIMDAGMNCASRNTSSKSKEGDGDESLDCDGIEFENGSCKTLKPCKSASS